MDSSKLRSRNWRMPWKSKSLFRLSVSSRPFRLCYSTADIRRASNSASSPEISRTASRDRIRARKRRAPECVSELPSRSRDRVRHRRAAASNRRLLLPGSKSYFEPRPLHAGQAPYGELKLNERGSSCGTEMPQSGQASFSEKTCSLPPTIATVTSPFASFSAVAMDCSRRAAMPGFTSRRSTTTSIV